MIGFIPLINADSYVASRPDGDERSLPSILSISVRPKELLAPNKSRLLYHVNRLTGVHRLCISPFVARDLCIITYGESYLGFSCFYKMITRSWFIRGLIKLLHSVICNCFSYLALQSRQHSSYELL